MSGNMSPFPFLVGASLILGLLRADSVTLPLWPGGTVPGSRGTNDADIPTLTYYPANGRGAGTAVIIAPGGGYTGLAMNHEGRQVANWLNSLGVSALVLKYRLGPRYHHPIELGVLQVGLKILELGHRFDQAIGKGVLPPGLQHITLFDWMLQRPSKFGYA
jgi:acetyl esterase/lipase